MRKIVGFITILALLGACGTDSGEGSASPIPSNSVSPSPSQSYLFETDPEILGPDLQVYLNTLGNIGALENEVVGLFDAVSGENFTTNEQLQKQLELIIPKAEKFISKLQKINVKHPEITHFHEQYVAIWQQQLAAFKEMDVAIQNDDQSALQAAAAEVEIARGKITPLQAELKALTEYSGIEIVF
jgi:hypothetical protein